MRIKGKLAHLKEQVIFINNMTKLERAMQDKIRDEAQKKMGRWQKWENYKLMESCCGGMRRWGDWRKGN